MTNTQKDFIVQLVAGTILVCLTGFVLTTDWSLLAKLSVIVLVVVVAVGVVMAMAPVGRRMRSIGGKLSKPPADVLDASRDRLDETWFVSFTSGPYPIGEDRREQYVTAIAAVDQVSGDDVSLLWRDRGSFPTSVPIKLLQAPHVHRFRTSAEGAYRIRVQNEGLRSTGPGGVITGTGWQAHRNSPDRIAFARYRNLSPDDQKSMEADADLDTYDLDAL